MSCAASGRCRRNEAAILGSGYPPLFGHRAGAAPLFEPCRRGGRETAARPLAAGRLCGYGQRCRPPPVGENRAGRRLDACRDRPPRPGKTHGAPAAEPPGLAAGAVLFLLLVRALGGLVWCIDFGAMDPGLQPAMRRLLADCGIHEGVLLTKPLLQTAQAQALRRSEVFGWVSLNFTGGCLAIESTPSQTQTVREPPPRQGLYASADGEILAVEIESGFAAVAVGQTVARGQLLAAAERLDRKGNAVPQGAGGRVIAQVQKHYTARQSLTAEAPIYTGRNSVQTTLYLPWRSYTDEPEDPLTGITQTDWLPVQLGRLALPASLCRVTTWEQLPDTVQYSEAAAAALALRACRAALLAEFPDAVIEAEQREISAQEGEETAAVTYIFTANIAAPP